jgi:predicted nucleic acid-binding protein
VAIATALRQNPLGSGERKPSQAREEASIRGFLSSFEVLELSAEIDQEAITIRQEWRLKIPDAIVYATAKTQGCLLVSRNTRDLKSDRPDIRIPYHL